MAEENNGKDQGKEEGQGTDLDATDRMPENVPDAPGTGGEQIGRRKGMFGVRGSGDTSGYGGLTRPVQMPGHSHAAVRRMDGRRRHRTCRGEQVRRN